LHIFSDEDSKWIAEEVLYASDTCVEDYYTRFHAKNKGKTTEFGIAKFDVTHLKDQMQMHIPDDVDDGWERYEVVLRIELKVIDRHMEFRYGLYIQARYCLGQIGQAEAWSYILVSWDDMVWWTC
jgi:hypothetical protein